jgi:glycosyltransferase involved in cell wall biosynthesis
MHSNLNILITIESFWDGGAEMFAIRLANELSINNNVFFLELYPYKTREKRQIKFINTNKIKLFQIGKNFLGDWLAKKAENTSGTFSRFLKAFHSKLCIYQTKSILHKYNIDVVNSHSWDTDLYFASLKDKSRFNFVSTFHGHYEFLKSQRFNFNADAPFVLSKLNHVIYTTTKHINTLNNYNYPEIKRHKIFYGISLSIADEVTSIQKNEALKIIMVARGIEEKGWEQAILAVIELSKSYPQELILQLVGEGSYLDSLKDKYQSETVQFLGYFDNVKEVISKAHIGILPTYYSAESLPNSVIEYLVCGKPVVTTKVGAIPEMIDVNDNIAGQCLGIENGKADVQELAKAIEYYILNPEIVAIHSSLALEAAKKFTMNKCVNEYLQVFQIS